MATEARRSPRGLHAWPQRHGGHSEACTRGHGDTEPSSVAERRPTEIQRSDSRSAPPLWIARARWLGRSCSPCLRGASPKPRAALLSPRTGGSVPRGLRASVALRPNRAPSGSPRPHGSVAPCSPCLRGASPKPGVPPCLGGSSPWPCVALRGPMAPRLTRMPPCLRGRLAQTARCPLCLRGSTAPWTPCLSGSTYLQRLRTSVAPRLRSAYGRLNATRASPPCVSKFPWPPHATATYWRPATW